MFSRLHVRSRAVPEDKFQRIATANAHIAVIAKSLGQLASELDRTDHPEQAARLRQEVARILDNVDAISDSVLRTVTPTVE